MIHKSKAKTVTCFLENCRDHGIIKDDLWYQREEVYKHLYELGRMVESLPELKEVFIKLENGIGELERATQERYLQYGAALGDVIENFNLD